MADKSFMARRGGDKGEGEDKIDPLPLPLLQEEREVKQTHLVGKMGVPIQRLIFSLLADYKKVFSADKNK
jgi:hypothetical protein